MSSVTVDQPSLSIYQSLNDKLLELRAKRDAIALHHEELKAKNDTYNKAIIIMSLFCAFVETTKMQMGLQESDGLLYDVATLSPVLMSTLVSVVSSLLKFKKFPEKMEVLVQVSDKANYAIEKIRKLQERVHFQEDPVVFESYMTDVTDSYRDALMHIETAIYPDKRAKYYRNAQKNFIKIKKDEVRYVNEISKFSTTKDKNNVFYEPCYAPTCED